MQWPWAAFHPQELVPMTCLEVVFCVHTAILFKAQHLCCLFSTGVEMLKVLESLVCPSATLATAGALALRKCSLARLIPLLLITCSSWIWVVSHGQVNPNNFKQTMQELSIIIWCSFIDESLWPMKKITDLKRQFKCKLKFSFASTLL